LFGVQQNVRRLDVPAYEAHFANQGASNEGFTLYWVTRDGQNIDVATVKSSEGFGGVFRIERIGRDKQGERDKACRENRSKSTGAYT
jgi:hypothetical protein